jgi:hypothetical protein
MPSDKQPMMEAHEALLADAEQREALSPNHFYNAKKVSIRAARRIGLTDAQIERLFGLTLKPEDRSA